MLAAALVGGVALALFDEEDCPLGARVAAGAALGLALLALLGYVTASWFGLNRPSIAAAASTASASPFTSHARGPGACC